MEPKDGGVPVCQPLRRRCLAGRICACIQSTCAPATPVKLQTVAGGPLLRQASVGTYTALRNARSPATTAVGRATGQPLRAQGAHTPSELVRRDGEHARRPVQMGTSPRAVYRAWTLSRRPRGPGPDPPPSPRPLPGGAALPSPASSHLRRLKFCHFA